MVTASLTSVAAPSYTMDAVPVASDWATASLGTSYKLNSRVMLRGSLFDDVPQSAGGKLRRRVGPERQFLKQPGLEVSAWYTPP